MAIEVNMTRFGASETSGHGASGSVWWFGISHLCPSWKVAYTECVWLEGVTYITQISQSPSADHCA